MNNIYSLLENFESGKIELALKRLEFICSPEGKAILDCLQEFDGLPFVDILIKTEMDTEQLQTNLNLLLDFGMIRKESNYYIAEHYLNIPKFYRIQELSKTLVNDLKLVA